MQVDERARYLELAQALKSGVKLTQAEMLEARGLALRVAPRLRPISEPPPPPPEHHVTPDPLANSTPANVARLLLNESDYVVLKAVEQGRALSQAWLAWRDSLRGVVNTNAGEIGEEPVRWT